MKRVLNFVAIVPTYVRCAPDYVREIRNSLMLSVLYAFNVVRLVPQNVANIRQMLVAKRVQKRVKNVRIHAV